MDWLFSLDSKKLSILLTAVSFVLLVIAGSFQVLGKAVSASPFDNIFFACLTLVYGSHHLNINGKSFSNDGDSK